MSVKGACKRMHVQTRSTSFCIREWLALQICILQLEQLVHTARHSCKQSDSFCLTQSMATLQYIRLLQTMLDKLFMIYENRYNINYAVIEVIHVRHVYRQLEAAYMN